METIIQAVFFQTKKFTNNYNLRYFKKVGENQSEKIKHSEYMDLLDKPNVKVAQPIYKDLK